MSIKSAIPIITAVSFSLQQIWRYRKTYVILLTVFTVIQGLVPVVVVWTTQEMVNSITLMVTEGSSPQIAIFYFSLQIVLLLIMYVIEHLRTLNDQKTKDLLGKVVYSRIIDKISKLPFVSFESPEIYNKIQRVSRSQSIFATVTESLMELLKNIITIVSVLGYLLHIHWFFIVIITVGVMPLLYIQLKFGYKKYELNRFLTPLARKEGYIGHLLRERDTLKEIKLYGLIDHLKGRWQQTYDKNVDSQYHLLRRKETWTFTAEIIVTITYALSGIFTILLIFRSSLMVGSFVAVLQAVQNIQDSMEMSSMKIADIYEEALYVNEYREFISLPDEGSQGILQPVEKIDSIELKNISFQYPTNIQKSIVDIDLEIPIGKNITIIGQNGSGKTTLTKCLSGLYEISEGEMMINNKNIKEVDKDSYQKRIAVLFQDYVKYMFSVKENIGFGNHERMNEHSKVKESAKVTGLDDNIENMPQKYDTELGNLFGEGSQLSGGQWQKLALSRALFRDSDLIILDEPTSSLDPLSEVSILENLYSNAMGKSIICITHRIGPALLSDEIIVMKEGEIAERGTHHELMSLEGDYYTLYCTQEKWYRSEEEAKT